MTNLVMKVLIIIMALLQNVDLHANLLSLIMWKLYVDMHLIAVRDYMVVCVCRQN